MLSILFDQLVSGPVHGWLNTEIDNRLKVANKRRLFIAIHMVIISNIDVISANTSLSIGDSPVVVVVLCMK